MIMFVAIIPFLLFLSCAAAGEVKKIAEPVIHGEGPHWDNERQVLYYVDITGQTVNKYDPKTESVSSVHIDGGPVTLVVPDKFEPERFVVGRGRDIVNMTWDGKSPEPSSLTVLASVDGDKPENRFNDGKVDASGRLWAGRERKQLSSVPLSGPQGQIEFTDERLVETFDPVSGTMGPENPDLVPLQGSLYSFDWSDQFKPVTHISPVSVSNGIAWNNNDTLMYYIDSPTRVINVFDFDILTGSISNKRELFSLDKHNIIGFPDGMAIDANDNLWVAVYKGSCLLHIDTKEGKLLEHIHLPVSQVTSCAFGGADLEDLYVTTSKVTLTEEEIRQEPLAGALFKVTSLGVRGQLKSNTIRIP